MYTTQDYKNMLQMDGKRHLLVEGTDDHRFFLALFEELLGSSWMRLHNVEIDKAEIFFGAAPEKRRAVEDAVTYIAGTSLRDKIVGFVDREFRGFEINGLIVDHIRKHAVNDRTLWTKGHSVENYFFDENILLATFRNLSDDIFSKSRELFINNLDSYFHIASTISLIAKENGCLTKIRRTVKKWEMLRDDGTIDFPLWKKQLETSGFSSREIEKILSSYNDASKIISSSEVETLRWFCDGHLTFSILWSAYTKCVHSVTKNHAEAQQTQKLGEDARFNFYVSVFAKLALHQLCEYPKEVFRLLEINRDL